MMAAAAAAAYGQRGSLLNLIEHLYIYIIIYIFFTIKSFLIFLIFYVRAAGR